MFEDDSREGYENGQDGPKVYENGQDDSPKAESIKKSGKFGKGHAGALGLLVLLLVKFKSAILVALPFLKGGLILAKMGKFAGTFISMLVTVLIYMRIDGLPFAVGFVMLIFLHELGHSLMAKYEGLDVSTPMFIPFVGAFIRMKELPKIAMPEAPPVISSRRSRQPQLPAGRPGVFMRASAPSPRTSCMGMRATSATEASTARIKSQWISRPSVFRYLRVNPRSLSMSLESITRSSICWFSLKRPPNFSISSTRVVLPWST
jgi:hypothetical protein